jgi:spore maturation protein CgeB
MKFLFAGTSWQHLMYEPACSAALERLGVDIIPFSLIPQSNNWLAKFEYKYSVYGPHLKRLQHKLLKQVIQYRPDVVLIWLGSCVFPQTLHLIKQVNNPLLVSYIHDDPFAHRFHRLSPSHHRWHWKAFIEGLVYYDLALFSKQQNADEAYQFGAQKTGVLPQYFVPEIHFPHVLTQQEEIKFKCDVAFAGHFEPDGREQCIRSLVKAGLKVNIYADFSWKKVNMSDLSPNFKQLPRASGNDYPKALAGADMCLCFMSKMNRDRYTTRCFEIPACGRLLIAERTAELSQMFKEDEEACFFSSTHELVEKVLWLKNHPTERNKIAQAGMRRVYSDGHSVNDRMKYLLSLVNELMT